MTSPGDEKSTQMDAVSRSHPFKRSVPVLTLLFLVCILPAVARPQGRPTSILILHRELGDSAGFNLYINGLRTEMERESASPAFVYEEGLDRYEGATDRSLGKDNPFHVASHLNLLGTKYRNRKIDVIVPVGSELLNFSERYRQMYAPQAKIVYFAVGGAALTSFPATGFVLRFDLGPTIDLALQQNPGAHHFLIITGTSPADEQYRHFFDESVQRKAAESKGRIAFEYVGQDQSFEQLRQHIAAAGPGTILMFLTYDSDSAGQYFTSLQALRALAQSASRPMYSWA